MLLKYSVLMTNLCSSSFDRLLEPIIEPQRPLNCYPKCERKIQLEHYSRDIPQNKVYHRFQQPISVPFPCRYGRRT